ncbi:beta-lactamase family protein [Algoriphagus lutimaris]|uniref:serine hydrolase domain-containing protein n=1 Tax=Algoriphagus lutimaris TaxID=613197 RepID=UPI00196AC179|nr:serine hydrolase domain-containing protein [Algoriphagus lutimaris]MBN3521137.1 beta-lactamase family protein [Algoriphagus lutimaris]
MKQRFIYSLFILLFSGATLIAQDFNKLDQYFDSLEVHDKFMGNVLLKANGEVLYARSLGFKDVGEGVKLDDDTRFRVGSITKMFTTVMVFQAVEEGKMKLDQKLSEFIPEIPHSDQITISMLLQHRSGIHNFTNDDLYDTYFTSPQTREQLVEIIKDGGSDFEPDSKGEYSNSNFVLLTFILEDVYNESYSELVEEKITKPLQLEHTLVGQEKGTNEAKSYSYEDGWEEEQVTDMSIPLGAGAIVSTAEDLGKFIEGLFSGKLISEESLALMKEIKDGYGRGMFQFPYYEKIAYGHNGGIDGFSSMIGYLPAEDVTVCILSNGSNYNNNNIILAILDTQFGREVKIPNFQTATLTEEELDQYLGEYASDQIPLKMTFVKEGNTLIAKPTGQPDTPLEARGNHVFEFVQAGATMIFDPEKGEMTLKQGGATILFQRIEQ